MKTKIPTSRSLSFATFLVVLISGLSAALAVPAGLTLQGRLLNNGVAVESASVVVTVKVTSIGASECTLYEENQTLNMTNSDGVMAVTVGSGTRTANDKGFTLAQVFSNKSTALTGLTCSAGGTTYTPATTDSRNIYITFNDGGTIVAMASPFVIQSVPYALEADSLSGKSSTDFLQVTTDTTQAKTNQIMVPATFTELIALAGGTSTQYATAASASFTANVDLNSHKIIDVATPTNGTDAANKTYVDSNLGTKTLDSTTIAALNNTTDAGKVLSWTGTQWTAAAPAGDATKLPLAGGTMSGAIAMGANNITGAGYITQGAGKYIQFGQLDNTAETTLVATPLTAAYAGATWFNTSTSQLKYWDGSSVKNVSGSSFANGGNAFGANSTIGNTDGYSFTLMTNNSPRMTITAGGNVGIGTVSPTAKLMLAAGTASAGTAPLKFTQGTLMTTAEDGAMEYDSSGLWFTIGSTRYVIPTNTTAGNFSNVTTISNSAGSITMSPLAGNSVVVNVATTSTSSSTGALIVNGGVGIAGDVNTGGNMTVAGAVTATTNMVTPQLYGSTAASGNIKIDGTSNATTGNVLLASAGGKVGIGTTAPNAALSVVGSSDQTQLSVRANSTQTSTLFSLQNSVPGTVAWFTSTGGLVLNNTISNTSNTLASSATINTNGAQDLALQTSGSNRLYIQNSTGNVGIGTTAPSGTLNVVSTSGTSDQEVGYRWKVSDTTNDAFAIANNSAVDARVSPLLVGRSNNSAYSGLYLRGLGSADSGTTALVGFDAGILSSGDIVTGTETSAATRPLFQFSGNGSRMMTISASGTVGIGTTAAGDLLDIGRNTGAAGGMRITNLSTAGLNNYDFYEGTTQRAFMQYRGSTFATDPNVVRFGTQTAGGQVTLLTGAGFERMRIDSSGNVGIGTTSPSAKLTLAAGTATASTAPLKFTSGTLLTTAEDGAMEYNSGTGLWFTIGSTRYVIPINTAAGNYSGVSTISNSAGSITMSPLAGNSVIVNVATTSTSSSTGALIVNGGVGIAGAVNTGGNIVSGGAVTATTNMVTPQLYGSSSAGGNILIDGTSNATPGNVLLASAGGRVGIGTTSPSAPLHVYSTVNSDTFTVRSYGSAGAGSTFDINGGGYVGINQAGPQYWLDIQGFSTAGEYIRLHTPTAVANRTGTVDFSFLNSTSGKVNFTEYGGGIESSTAGSENGYGVINTVRAGTMTEAVRFTSAGYVGIGTTSPTDVIHTSVTQNSKSGLTLQNTSTGTSAGSMLTLTNSSNSAYLGLTSTGYSGAGLYVSNRAYLYGGSLGLSSASGPMSFFTGNTAAANERMRIDASGNVGIGTTSPSTMLTVYNSVAGAAALFQAPSTNDGFYIGTNSYTPPTTYGGVRASGGTVTLNAAASGILYFNRDATTIDTQFMNGTATSLMMIKSTGNVGIGTTSPSAKLHVAGPVISTPVDIATGATVDLSQSNTFTLDSVGGTAITLSNMVHGGTYTLVMVDTTSHQYTFSGCTNSYFKPGNAATTTGTQSIYTILTVKSGANWNCYISWATGYQ